MIHGFFSPLDSLPGVLLNPRKEGNPFNYCQNPVVRCPVPVLSGVRSSRVAAHGGCAPTLAAAKPALSQWLHLSVSPHFRDVKVSSAHAGTREAATLLGSTIRIHLAERDR